jgi:hypothetical protein
MIGPLFLRLCPQLCPSSEHCDLEWTFMPNIEVCRECGKPYELTEMGEVGPGNKMPEPINCPYCPYTYERMSRGFFQTSKLTPEQIADWEQGRAKQP